MTEKTVSKTSDIRHLTDFTVADVLSALGGTKNKSGHRLASLGIPETEMTQSVSLAVSALFEKVDDMTRELARLREQLAEMEQLVDVDCLAPIPNRRAFMRRLSWAIAMHERYGHPSSVLYFDLNGFKAINDNYGHAAGDQAIKHVAQILSQSLRESDFLARIGGDEFAIIMYYASADAAGERGKRIAERVQKTPFFFNDKTLGITTSFGVHAIHKGDDAEAALSAADTSMYLDKKRNKARATDISA